MTKLTTLSLLILLLISCSADSDHDYVDIEIPPELTNKKAIESLKKDEKQLNRVFNSMEDGMIAFTNMAEVIAEIEPDTPPRIVQKKIRKAHSKLSWSLMKAMYNGMYFLVREEIEKKSTQELLDMLKNEEKIVFTKSLENIKVKKEELEIQFDAYVARLDSLLDVINSKDSLLQEWKTDQ